MVWQAKLSYFSNIFLVKIFNFVPLHDLEPYYLWMPVYTASEDEHSPFYQRIYSEFHFDKKIYNFLIHPQWDQFGSNTLYIKILFCDYQEKYVIIELIGEWNDALYNDIMLLKREIIEHLMDYGIRKFILIGENVLNFHGSDDSYYEEWWQEVDEDDGWIALVNFREHVLQEMSSYNIGYYLHWGGDLDDMEWRKQSPRQMFDAVFAVLSKRLM